jgi:S-adenosylmethionine:diacylglycerol 3-amino-3-carboxypropyl transferase
MMAFWRRPDRPEAGIEPIEMNAQRYRAIENRERRGTRLCTAQCLCRFLTNTGLHHQSADREMRPRFTPD